MFEEITNWFNGVVNSTAPDQLPADAMPRGWNTFLTCIGDSTAQVSKRRGALTLNTTPVTGSPRILSGFEFKKRVGTTYEMLISDTGRLDVLNADFSLTVINATAFTSGTHYPNIAVANDLAFICNDVDQKKFNGTALQNFGITRPAAPTAAAAAGGAMATGLWDVGLTYFNSATGHESSLSDFTTVTLSAGNQKINVSWSAPSDLQVTHVRVYVRQQSAGGNTYRASAGATPAADATWGGYAGITSTVLDISAAQYAAFISIAPSTSENNPPAAGLQYPCWHQSRLFLADSGNVYWSKVKNNTPFPEAFDPQNVQPVNPNDGDTIVGLASFGGRLIVFKKFSVWAISGDDPNSWAVTEVCKDFGLSTMRSLVQVEGLLYWWAGALGPVVWTGGDLPIAMGKKLIADTLTSDVLNQTSYVSVTAAYDENRQTIIWSVPEVGQTRNTRLIPFNVRAKRFNADKWDPFDVSSLWMVTDVDQTRTLHLGNYGGQVFKWWAAGVDGVPSGTVSGTITSATTTVLTDSGAAFATTGAGLVERYVYVQSSDRTYAERRRITANTATTLTVTPAFTWTPNTTNTYVVGGIDFEVDTPWMLGQSGFLKKRLQFLLLQALSQDTGASMDVDIFATLDTSAARKTRTMAMQSSGGIYDTSLYDAALYAGSAMTFGKVRCGIVGRSWRARFRNLQPNVDIRFYRLAMETAPLGTKR